MFEDGTHKGGDEARAADYRLVGADGRNPLAPGGH